MAHDARQTSDGGYIVTGQIKTAAGDTDVYLLKLNASGNVAAGWPKTYGGARDDVGNAVLPVSDSYYGDGYIIVGVRNGGPSINEKVYMIRTDLAGTKIWEDYVGRFCGGAGEFGQDIAATPDGNYVITGTSGCFGEARFKGFLLKIDGDGYEVWSNAYNTLAATSESIYSVATVSNGFVLAGSRSLLSGQPPVAGPRDALVIKTDADGNELWRQTYGGAGRDEAKGVAQTKDGNYLILGYAQSYGGQISPNPDGNYTLEDLFLIKVDQNGNMLWQKATGNRPTISDYGEHVCAVSDGGFAVTGSSNGNLLLVKFDKNGDTVNLGDTDLSITIPATTGTINSANALDVAAAGVSGLTNPRQFGATALDLLINTAKGVTDFCSAGSYTFDPAPPVPLTTGSYAITFTNCVMGPTGEQSTITGGLTFTMDEVSGDPLSTAMSYTVQTTMTSINISMSDDVGTTTVTGRMRFRRVAKPQILAEPTFTETALSVDTPEPQTFTWDQNGVAVQRTHIIGPFSVSATVQGVFFSLGATTDTLTVDSGLGPLAVTVTEPVEGATDTGPWPTAGKFKIVAPDGSQEIITVTDGVAAVAVDTNGDGTVDGSISVPWDELY